MSDSTANVHQAASAGLQTALAGAVWTVVPHVETGSDLPYATHQGVLDLMGVQLRVYRLSNGQAVIRQEDLEALLFGGDSGAGREEVEFHPPLTDAAREVAISAARRDLELAHGRGDFVERDAAKERFCALIRGRSPEQVERMERSQGLQ